MPWKELAQMYLDQSINFLLTQKNLGQLVKIKWNFSKSSLIHLLKIILKLFVSILVDHGYHRQITSCFKLLDEILTQGQLLKYYHERADDWIIFHVNHAVKVDTFLKVVIISSDTDVFVWALYHFTHWMYSGLDELWIINEKYDSIATPVHTIVNNMDNSILDVNIDNLQYTH